MASFCKQCSVEVFDEDYDDYAGLTTPEQTAEGLFCVVLCESCGACQVDHTGKCISSDCLEKHGAA